MTDRHLRLCLALLMLVAPTAPAAAQPSEADQGEAGRIVARLLAAARAGDSAAFTALLEPGHMLGDYRDTPPYLGDVTLERVRSFVEHCRYAGPDRRSAGRSDGFAGTYVCNGTPDYTFSAGFGEDGRRIMAVNIQDPAINRQLDEQGARIDAENAREAAARAPEEARLRGLVESAMDAARTGDGARMRTLVATDATFSAEGGAPGTSRPLDVDALRPIAGRCRMTAETSELSGLSSPDSGRVQTAREFRLACDGGDRFRLVAGYDRADRRVAHIWIDRAEPPGR